MVGLHAPLHAEPVLVVGDDEVQAGVEACPAPHVLVVVTQGPPTPETLSVECLLVQILGTPEHEQPRYKQQISRSSYLSIPQSSLSRVIHRA